MLTILVPPRIFPRTLHSMHLKEVMHVTFHESHRLVLRNEERVEFDNTYAAHYIFSSKQKHALFQGDLRGKDLVATFDIDIIRSERSSRKIGEANFQDLKLWQDRCTPCRHSISFFANSSEKRFLEFRVLWFQSVIVKDANTKTARITFVQRNRGSGDGVRRRASRFLPRRRSVLSQSGSQYRIC